MFCRWSCWLILLQVVQYLDPERGSMQGPCFLPCMMYGDAGWLDNSLMVTRPAPRLHTEPHHCACALCDRTTRCRSPLYLHLHLPHAQAQPSPSSSCPHSTPAPSSSASSHAAGDHMCANTTTPSPHQHQRSQHRQSTSAARTKAPLRSGAATTGHRAQQNGPTTSGLTPTVSSSASDSSSCATLRSSGVHSNEVARSWSQSQEGGGQQSAGVGAGAGVCAAGGGPRGGGWSVDPDGLIDGSINAPLPVSFGVPPLATTSLQGLPNGSTFPTSLQGLLPSGCTRGHGMAPGAGAGAAAGGATGVGAGVGMWPPVAMSASGGGPGTDLWGTVGPAGSTGVGVALGVPHSVGSGGSEAVHHGPSSTGVMSGGGGKTVNSSQGATAGPAGITPLTKSALRALDAAFPDPLPPGALLLREVARARTGYQGAQHGPGVSGRQPHAAAAATTTSISGHNPFRDDDAIGTQGSFRDPDPVPGRSLFPSHHQFHAPSITPPAVQSMGPMEAGARGRMQNSCPNDLVSSGGAQHGVLNQGHASTTTGPAARASSVGPATHVQHPYHHHDHHLNQPDDNPFRDANLAQTHPEGCGSSQPMTSQHQPPVPRPPAGQILPQAGQQIVHPSQQQRQQQQLVVIGASADSSFVQAPRRMMPLPPHMVAAAAKHPTLTSAPCAYDSAAVDPSNPFLEQPSQAAHTAAGMPTQQAHRRQDETRQHGLGPDTAGATNLLSEDVNPFLASADSASGPSDRGRRHTPHSTGGAANPFLD